MNQSNIKIDKEDDILEKVDFVKDSWKFVPKHLIAIRNQQKKTAMKGLKKKLKDKDPTYQETTLQIINKNKNFYLTPVRDIEKIMKHFKKQLIFQQSKFQDPIKSTHEIIKFKTKKNRKSSLYNKIKTTAYLKTQNFEDSIDNKITRLLQLPTIKRAKSEAQKIKMIGMEQANKKSFQKQQILRKFNLYFSKQTDLINTKNTQAINIKQNDQNLRKIRAKTSID